MASNTSRLIVDICIGLFVAALSLACAPSWAAAEEPTASGSILDVDYVMYYQPQFPVWEIEYDVTNDAIGLWMEALSRPDSELQRVTIDTFVIARHRGMAGVEVVLPKLVELAGDSDVDATVRRSAVKALIAFEARDQAPLLWELAQQHGAAIATLVEPALFQWGSPLAVDVWTQRLNDTGFSPALLLTAIEGLGVLRHADAFDVLSRYVTDNSLPTRIRIAAARSLGQIRHSGLENQAAELIDSPADDIVSGVLAVELLRNHSGGESIELLKSLMTRENTAVRSRALARLYEIDFNIVLEFAATEILSRDANIRWTVAKALIDSRDEARIEPLSTLLDDVNPGLRRHVAAALVELAQDPRLRDEVIARTSGVLDQDAWRGCEQATRVLVSLDYKPAGDRLVDLIRHPRGEVIVTAGWGLRRLALTKHLPAMLGRAEEVYQGFRAREFNIGTPGMVDLMAQLFLAFAQMEYHEADALIRAYVPRDFSLGDRSRGAAAWAIGFLYPGQAPDDLVKLLVERLSDSDSPLPERDVVREMCAQSLGRMKAESALPALQKYATDSPDVVSLSCHWAIQQITGKVPPEPRRPRPLDYDDWFLKPIPSD